jgi:hypothetical protein
MKMIHTIACHKYASFQYLSIIFESEIILFNKVIHKVIPSFTPILFSSGIHKVRKFLLNLSMKC